MDCLVDTNIILRSADRLHPASAKARNAMKTLFRQGNRLCVAKQSLVEAWVVATRPRDVNGFGYSPQFAAEGLFKVKRLFHLLADTDDIYAEWEKLALAHHVIGKTAYDARLVATMNIHHIKSILTFNIDDFKRYRGLQMLHPDDVAGPKP
jgi:predicted nucleic acid-binding protein